MMKAKFLTFGEMSMSKKIQPLGNRVIVERIEPIATKGGILLPETAKEKPRQGKVVAVGPGKADAKGKMQKVELNVGDEVLFSSYAGTEYKTDGIDYLILSDEDVLAVFG